MHPPFAAWLLPSRANPATNFYPWRAIVAGAASLFRIRTKRRQPNEFREAYTLPAEANVMKALSRHFAAQSIIIPCATSASLSTPMTLEEMDMVADVFDRFLETQPASYESRLS